MDRIVTIVMYHYVRDLRHSRYPDIKGLDRSEFEGQIQYIKRHYDVIGGQDLIAAVDEKAQLPPRPILLTFDDGYIDHFTDVFPVLARERLPACFFPPAKCILEHKVLDVNKIHFILAASPDKGALVEKIFTRIRENQTHHDLSSPEEYWDRLGKPNRWDTAEVVFCKRILQRELPLEVRQPIVDELFTSFVTSDEESFACELYMTLDQIKLLRRHGMYIGSHGYDHFWLNRLTLEQQETEIDRSLRFLSSVEAETDGWIMCYPYGAYDESLLSVLQARRCSVGLTTEVGIASLDASNPLTLPRIDTNDLPKDWDALMNEWTARASVSAA